MNPQECARLDALDYLSPLVASMPDLRPHFKHLWGRRAAPSLGHVCYSDWADKPDGDPVFDVWKQCGFWTRDEVAILFHCAQRLGGYWVDVGANTGWTASYISIGSGCEPFTIDYAHEWDAMRERFKENCGAYPDKDGAMKSELFWEKCSARFRAQGFCIDAHHDWGGPLNDAVNAAEHLTKSGVIICHDFIGGPVQQAVNALIGRGFKCRVYFTPAMVACCWRGDFRPPDHVPDPKIAGVVRARCPEFDFSRCE